MSLFIVFIILFCICISIENDRLVFWLESMVFMRLLFWLLFMVVMWSVVVCFLLLMCCSVFWIDCVKLFVVVVFLLVVIGVIVLLSCVVLLLIWFSDCWIVILKVFVEGFVGMFIVVLS